MTKTTVEKDTLLAVLELNCIPDTLLDRAMWLAQKFDFKVHLVLFEPNIVELLARFPISSEAQTLQQDIERAQTELVEDHANRMRDAGLEVSTSVLRQRPLDEWLLEIIAELDPKLVIKATLFKSAAERSMLVNSDWQLMRTCPCPLWLVKSASMPENPLIVAAVDPGNSHDKPAALDHEIVRSAKAVAEYTQGDVHLLHTYERLSGIGAAATMAFKSGKLPIDEIDARIKSEHLKALHALATANDVALDHAHQLPGRAHEILPTFARSQNAGLVVMGVLARWGFKQLIIGSTAERVIDHIASDILIVRLGDHQLYE
jgi:universal stress protein E